MLRWWADLQFLIVTLQRMRTAARIALRSPSVRAEINASLDAFDKALPMLRTMRNVGEHIDDYAVDRGRDREVERGMLQVGTWNGTTYAWLGHELNIDAARDAAKALHRTVCDAARQPLDRLGPRRKGSGRAG